MLECIAGTTENGMERGEGTTTKQMQAAPKGAVFVWCNAHTGYATHLTRKIGREDLKIVSPTWLEWERWRGLELTGLVVDHAAQLTDMQWDNYQAALTRVRSNARLTGLSRKRVKKVKNLGAIKRLG